MRPDGRVAAVTGGVSDSAAAGAAVARAEAEFGPLDIFVNNAGASGKEHLRRVGEREAAWRAESVAGEVRTPLDALVRVSDTEWRELLAGHDASYFAGATLSPNGGLVTAV